MSGSKSNSTESIMTKLKTIYPNGWKLTVVTVPQMYGCHDDYPAYCLVIDNERNIKITVIDDLDVVRLSDICGIYVQMSYKNFSLSKFIQYIKEFKPMSLSQRSMVTGVNIMRRITNICTY